MALRVLQVVTSMNRGGVESWLMHVLRNIDRSRVHMDFLVQVNSPGAFDGEIANLGSKLHSCPRGRNPFRFAKEFLRTLRSNGPYDVVHTHLHHYSGFVALLARIAGVKVVITHSHNATYGPRELLAKPLRLYLSLTEWLISIFSDFGYACSEKAGLDLYNKRWKDKNRHAVMYCGLEFRKPNMRVQKLPKGVINIVHVGRFTAQKNHAFLIQIFAALVRKHPGAYHLNLVGTGALQDKSRAQVASLGLESQVTYWGERNDVADLMAQGDLFVMPSLHEGLPLVLIEAQAAGLACLVSDEITTEAAVIPKAVTFLPLQEDLAGWVAAIEDLASQDRMGPAEALSFMLRSPFTIERCCADLTEKYVQLAGVKGP